jgi:hypothetical protein
LSETWPMSPWQTARWRAVRDPRIEAEKPRTSLDWTRDPECGARCAIFEQRSVDNGPRATARGRMRFLPRIRAALDNSVDIRQRTTARTFCSGAAESCSHHAGIRTPSPAGGSRTQSPSERRHRPADLGVDVGADYCEKIKPRGAVRGSRYV